MNGACVMRILPGLIALLLPAILWAGGAVTTFPDYAAYAAFMDRHIAQRDVAGLLAGVGAGEAIPEQDLDALQARIDEAFPETLGHVTVSRKTDLGGGLHQELRVYWSDNDDYLFVYALYHSRADGMVVLQFEFDSDPATVMAAF